MFFEMGGWGARLRSHLCVGAAVVGALGAGSAAGADGVSFTAVEVREPMFAGEQSGLMRNEGEAFADQLAGYVANELGARVVKGDRRAVPLATRMLALALHLDPRNRKATVVNYQLARGVKPDAVSADYSKEVFSALLVTRAMALGASGAAESKLLAGFLFNVAAEIDPHNEDAVYEWEIYRLDHGEPDWRVLSAQEE